MGMVMEQLSWEARSDLCSEYCSAVQLEVRWVTVLVGKSEDELK